MVLIGLSGKKGSGKDTAALIIQELYPELTIIPFAGKLKKIVSILTDTSIEDNYNNKDLIPNGFKSSIGVYQQLVGNTLRNVIDPEIWLNNFPTMDVIIPDVRYKNEAEFIKKNNGLLIRIERNNMVSDSRDSSHISETDLDDYNFKYVINNNGTVEEFKETIVSLIQSLLNKDH
jgi:thymidylate kinase